MNGRFQFLTTTVIGGIVFLVPIIVLIMIIDKAFDVMRKLVTPLADVIPIDSIGGFAVANVIAIAAIIMVCFIAGLLAKTGVGSGVVNWLETNLLSKIPVYTFIKGMTDSVAGLEESEDLKPVLVKYDDNWQVAFEVERIDDGYLTVYVPAHQIRGLVG